MWTITQINGLEIHTTHTLKKYLKTDIVQEFPSISIRDVIVWSPNVTTATWITKSMLKKQ